MDVIQTEPHKVVLEWNVHSIRPSTNLEAPSGKPDILYFLPESRGSQDYSIPIDVDEIDIAEHMCATRPQDVVLPSSN